MLAICFLNCLLVLPASAAQDRRQPTDLQWRCSVPATLEGPIDAAIPPYGRVWYAHACAGRDGRVAVAWVRTVSDDRLEWVPDLKLWRVKGSTRMLEPGETLPGLGPLFERPEPPRSYQVFEPGGYVGMALLGPTRLEAVDLLRGVGPRSGLSLRNELLGCIGTADGSWEAVLSLCPWNTQNPTDEKGLAVAGMDERGWREAHMVVGGRVGKALALFNGERARHLFWLEDYSRRWGLPEFMGGEGRCRLNHTRIDANGQVSTESVYEESDPAWRIGHQVVALGADRYDLVLRHQQSVKKYGEGAPDRLLHVANLLGGDRSERVVTVLDSSSSFAAFTRPNGVLQLLWLEPLPRDRGLQPPSSARLVESHLVGGAWSKPAVVYQGEAVQPESLAAAGVSIAGSDLVVVVWRGRGAKLSYCVSPSADAWSAPEAGELEIGSANWLVGCGERVAFITLRADNLYWCWLTPSEDARRGQSSQPATQEAHAHAP